MRKLLLTVSMAIVLSLLLMVCPTAASGLSTQEDPCCNTPGDANNNGSGPDILDITYLLNFLYRGGVAPPCMAEGDVNGNGAINILDVNYIILYLYKGGPAPVCGPDPWPTN